MTGGSEVDFRPDHNPPDALLAELKFLCPTINSILHAAHPNEVPLQDFVTIVTMAPTVSPTEIPTAMPTATPTALPTATPTFLPTATPATPTALPTAALQEPALPTAVPTVVPTAAPQTQQDGLTQDDTATTMTTVTMTFSQASLGLQASQVPPESVLVEMLEAIKFMTENYYNNNGALDHNRRRRLATHSRRRHLSSSTTLELRDVVHHVSTTLVYHSSRLYADHNLVQVFYNQTLTVTVPQNFALDAQDVALDPFDSPSKQGALLALSAFADYPTLLWMLEGQDVLASMLATKEPTMAPTGGAQGEEKEKEDQDQQDEPTSLGTPKDDEDTPEGEVPHAVNSEEGKNYGPGAIVVLVFLILGLVRVVFWLAQRQYRKFANPIAESEEKPLSSTKTGTNKLSTSRDEDNVTTVSYANTQSEVGWGDGMGQSGRSLIVEEERLVEVALPPGKLGLILSTTHAGTPVVRSVKETSAVDHLIAAEDKLLKVDEVDVEHMPVTKICTLLSQRAKNPERVLTVIRAVPMMDHHEDPDDVSDNRRERTYDEEDPWVPVKDPSGRRTSFYNRNSGVVALEQARENGTKKDKNCPRISFCRRIQ